MPVSYNSVLLVEDEPQLAMVAEQLLLDYGIAEVRIAETASSALSLAARQRFDLLLCDLGLPGKDGLWLLREISALNDPPAVILLSGVDPILLRMAENLARDMGLRVLGALSKPFTTERFYALLMDPAATLHLPALRSQPSLANLVPDAVLLEGLQQNWYQPYFESRIAAEGGRVEGVEVLARLLPPGKKAVLPEHFIERLEALGRIDQMTWLVAAPGFALARRFRDEGHPLSLSLNLSAQMLKSDALLDRLDECRTAHGLKPGEITLEITESAAIDSSAMVLERLVQLRLRGFGLAIDDFGTGFSSLAQLSKMPFTEMKIDRLFTSTVVSNPKSLAVVESSIDLARRLGMKTCAEGVDSETVYRLMRELGTDSFQGYHFHRPLPASEFTRWVQAWPVTGSTRAQPP